MVLISRGYCSFDPVGNCAPLSQDPDQNSLFYTSLFYITGQAALLTPNESHQKHVREPPNFLSFLTMKLFALMGHSEGRNSCFPTSIVCFTKISTKKGSNRRKAYHSDG